MVARFLGYIASGRTRRLSGDYTFRDRPNALYPFKEHYRENILPHVQKFDKRRIESLAALRKRCFLGIPAILGVIFLLIAFITAYNPGEALIKLAFGGAFLAVSGIGYWVYHPVKKYKSKVKGEIFPSVFSFFGDGYTYTEHCPVAVSSLEPSGIIPYYTSVKTEDYLKGRHNSVDLQLFEAELKERSGSGKNRRTVTVFKGLFITFSMNKPFKGRTLLRRDKGKIFNWLTNKTSHKELEAVRLEDPVFEKKFEVYSTDQIEARYLLTTSFMQRLLDMSALFDNARIECSLYENQVLLKIPSKENKFETSSIFKPATFEEDIHMILEEMGLIFKMIDILKLQEETRL